MVIKYVCTKCGRRFVDWGAEKLGFKCPSDDCDDITLVQLGSEELAMGDDKPKAARSKKRKAIVPVVSAEVDLSELDDDFAEGDDISDDDMDEEEDIEEDVAVPIVTDDDDDVDAVEVEADDDVVADDDAFADAIDIDDGDAALDDNV